jgi:tetratricopeptide (TPR) repeat protein
MWPDLEARYYTTADTAVGTAPLVMPRVLALRALRNAPPGTAPVVASPAPRVHPPAHPRLLVEQQDLLSEVLPADAPPAAHYLAADLEYLRAPTAGESAFRALALYRRAVRLAPQFPDRHRAELMIGVTELDMALAAEAEASFLHVVRTATAPAIVGLGHLGAARSRRASGHPDGAVAHLRQAISVASREGAGCFARGDLALILAESGRAPEAIGFFDEVREICPGYVIRAPRMLLKHAAVLATAGRMEAAEELLLALPRFEGELFLRQKLLEGDLAVAMQNPAFARRAYEAVRMADDVASPVKTEATLRLARVEDAQGDHERAGVLLAEVATRQRKPGERARAIVTAAELLARRERYAESFRLLESADRLGPPGFALGEEVRARTFRAWMEELTAQGNDAGILAMFYGYRSDGVGGHLRPREIVRVAEAAARLGLPELVVPILSTVEGRVRGATRAHAGTLLAEAALAQGEGAAALRATGDVARSARDLGQLAVAERIRGQALLQLGRIDEAAAVLRAGGERDDLLALGAAYLRDGHDVEKAQSVLAALLSEEQSAGGTEPDTLEAWLGLVDAAEASGDNELALAALRTALERFPDDAVRGVHYRLARLESHESDPGRAAEAYATAAEREPDRLLARAAEADAAYYRVVLQHEGTP